MRKFVVALAAFGFAMSAARAQESCAMNYPVFEGAIPHLDLAACPKDIARPGAFCRVTTANDAVHVFMFEEKGKQCLLAAKSYRDYKLDLK
ncbi:MAG: hypothetical protein IPK23_15540 [Rhizobiales bacterium]|nr:hypothetical protein [Hyphomicrobiales bacterium]